MKTFLRSTPAFIGLYLLFMLPTYLLPYLGSNSTLVNGVSAALGMGFSPMWWAHFWALSMLFAIAASRGDLIGKRYIAWIAGLAGIFDLTPILSAIPFVPTVIHVVTIILGIEPKTEVPEKPSNEPLALAALVTIAAIVGSIVFVTTAGRNSQQASEEAARQVNVAPLVVPVQPIVTPLDAGITVPHVSSKDTRVNQPTPTTQRTAQTQMPVAAPKVEPAPVVRHINLND